MGDRLMREGFDSDCFIEIGGLKSDSLTHTNTDTLRSSYPYYRESVVVMVIGDNPESQLWGFLDPFDITLWSAIIASFLIVPMVVFLMDAQHRGKQILTSWPKLFTLLWQCLGMFTNYDAIIPIGLPARVVSIVYGFTILIVLSSYTANLAAFLTSSRLDLKASGFSALAGSRVLVLEDYVTTMSAYSAIPIAVDLLTFSSEEMERTIMQGLYNGTYIAAALDFPVAGRVLMKDSRCKIYLLDGAIALFDLVFVFSDAVNESDIAALDVSIANLIGCKKIVDLEGTWILFNNPDCKGTGFASSIKSETSPFQFADMAGLWIVLGVSAAAGLLLLFLNELIYRLPAGVQFLFRWQNLQNNKNMFLL
jgi:hypothetical protein